VSRLVSRLFLYYPLSLMPSRISIFNERNMTLNFNSSENRALERKASDLHQRLAALSWLCSPRSSTEWWADMARQFPRVVRLFDHSQLS